jgi:hypothetical protein
MPGSLQFLPQVKAAGSKGRKANIRYTATLTAKRIEIEIANRFAMKLNMD